MTGPRREPVPVDAERTEPIRPVADQAGQPEQPEQPEREFPTLMEQMGGVAGVIATSIPVIVFVVANLLLELQPAIITAVAAGVVVAVVRVVRKQPVMPAVSGLLGVGVCAFIALRTGEARGFYLPGLLISSAGFLAFTISVIARWPLAGVIWNGVNGHGHAWRQNPRMLRAYAGASLLWALMFLSRVVLQGFLYWADEATWLGVARLVMGYPFTILAVLGTVWAVRRADRAETAGTAT